MRAFLPIRLAQPRVLTGLTLTPSRDLAETSTDTPAHRCVPGAVSVSHGQRRPKTMKLLGFAGDRRSRAAGAARDRRRHNHRSTTAELSSRASIGRFADD